MNEHDWRREMDRQRSAIDAAIENLIQQDVDKLNAHFSVAETLDKDWEQYLADVKR